MCHIAGPPSRLPPRIRRLFEAETHVAHEDDVEAGARGGDKDPARRLVELMAEPRSRDKWERRRRRAIVLTIVSVLLAVLVATVLVVAFDRGFIPVMSPNRVGVRMRFTMRKEKCTECGAELPPRAKFCVECAHPVGAPSAAPTRAPTPAARP